MNPWMRLLDRVRLWPWAALLLAGLFGGWMATRPAPPPVPDPRPVAELTPGVVARMDSPAFTYQGGWRISPQGADTLEPADPWHEPAGVLTFVYRGQDLALQVAMGDYWGYMFVTVDEKPANRLAVIWGNRDSRGRPAGYKPFLAPERQTADGPTPVWVPVHRADGPGPHTVRVEVWRSWGQVPLRAVAVDALPPSPWPRWPVVLLALLGLGGLVRQAWPLPVWSGSVWRSWPGRAHLTALAGRSDLLLSGAGVGVMVTGLGMALGHWWLTDLGLALLALVGWLRPVLWIGALLLALPFYLVPLPVLPGRAVHLVEPAVWGGLILVLAHRTLLARAPDGHQNRAEPVPAASPRDSHPLAHPLAWLVAVALLATVDAAVQPVAWREWRTVFLAGAGFGLLLWAGAGTEDDAARLWRGWMTAWLLGGVLVAAVAVAQYLSGAMVIQAEGVARVRAFYGSPNNLALYLERTTAAALALALFARRGRWLWGVMGGIQLLALLLTFSKGALFLALPAILAVLALGGRYLLHREGRSTRLLWTLGGIGVGVVLLLTPFVGAERFRSLLDLGPESTAGLRLNLWRSALAMALDHPLWGVGPDNFLYAYRSGYILPAAWRDPNLNHPHNVILDWWTRLGIPGLMVAGWWWGGGIWRQVQRLGRAPSAWGVAVLAAIAGGLAHGLIDASYALPDLMLVWVWLLAFRAEWSAGSPPGSRR